MDLDEERLPEIKIVAAIRKKEVSVLGKSFILN